MEARSYNMATKKQVNKNLANGKDVKKAEEIMRKKREDELNDIRFILETIQGRRFLWRMLKECKTFGSVWEPSAKIHYNSGKQDLGHYIMSEVIAADENLLFKIMKENQKQGETNV